MNYGARFQHPMAAPEPRGDWMLSCGIPHFRKGPKDEEDSPSLGSHRRFACDHMFGLLASPTPELSRVSGRPIASLPASYFSKVEGLSHAIFFLAGQNMVLGELITG
jgi:hypothetical protein